MITSLIQEAGKAANDTVIRASLGIVIGLLAVVALFFFTLAAFVWIEDQYDAVIAGLALGIFFLALDVAVLTAAWFRCRSRSRAERETRAGLQQSLSRHDSLAIAAGTEVLRLFGAKRIFPALALSAVILGALQAAPRIKSGTAQEK